jgi:hypothetical protein
MQYLSQDCATTEEEEEEEEEDGRWNANDINVV